jgi:Fe-S cluster assembly protein SufD
MGIQSFLKAQKGDPDWAFTPEHYFDKEFKIIDASQVELAQDQVDQIVLRQNPNEKEMLAKHINIDVRENATLDLTILNDAADKLQQVFIYDIRLRAGAKVSMGLFVKGGKLNKHIIQLMLEDDANFNAYGHAQNTVGGDCEIITKVIHKGIYSISNQFFTTEAGTGSQTVFQSMVNIPKESEYCQIGVENVNLITGPSGRCHSVPEIYNHSDTAKITSGTTTNAVDPEKLYYLQTRGLTKSHAENMVVDVHRNIMFTIIQNSEIKEEVTQLFS